jgi:hypothetical protein
MVFSITQQKWKKRCYTLWPSCLRRPACWDYWFESRRRHRCLFLMSVVCRQVEVSATHPEGSYQLRCVIVCNLATSTMRRPWPALGCCARERERERQKRSDLCHNTWPENTRLKITGSFLILRTETGSVLRGPVLRSPDSKHTRRRNVKIVYKLVSLGDVVDNNKPENAETKIGAVWC